MSRIAEGGKAVYGASVGILMLEARFPRIPGDIGNAETWPFPVHFRVVRGASPDRVVRRRAEGLLDDFIAAAKDLVATGADGITTNCGFLALFQKELSAAVGVPVATSSMMQYGVVQSLLPPSKRVGILTVSKASLSPDHLNGAGVPLDAPVVGMDEEPGEFIRAILGNAETLDVDKAEAEMVAAARKLASRNDIGAILCECTNMAPYSHAVAKATGLPVFDMYDFICWFHTALRPRQFAG